VITACSAGESGARKRPRSTAPPDAGGKASRVASSLTVNILNHLRDSVSFCQPPFKEIYAVQPPPEDWDELERERGAPAGEALWQGAATESVDDQDADAGDAAAVVAEVAVDAPKMTWGEAVDKFKRGH
jgi:hypothetical protein